jgi:hypothetical protein
VILCEPVDGKFIQESEGPYDGEFSIKEGLERHHGTDLATVAHIQEQGFNNIVLMVAKRQFLTPPFISQLKETLSSKSGTKETRIFTILLTVRLSSIVGMLDMKLIAHCLAVISNSVGGIPFKAKVYVNGNKGVTNGNAG